jgi:hypothetical protein
MMKQDYTTGLIGIFLFPILVFGQGVHTIPFTPSPAVYDPQVQGPRAPQMIVARDGPEYTAIWSEDFSAGLSAGWLNQGLTVTGAPNPSALWEYRGPTTTPNVNIGSRGGTFSNTTPIRSTTAANGFMIFDSDFLDNAGNANAPGTGTSPGPHVGTLVSPVINLGMEPNVILLFEQHFFMHLGGTGATFNVPTNYLEFSTDGGVTWGNRQTLNIGFNNVRSRNPFLEYMDVSAFIGGSANARFRFVFEGSGVYWMVDDVSIVRKPSHALHVGFTYQGLKHGVLYDTPSINNPLYGHMTGRQCRNIYFYSEFFNSGLLPQTNVRLGVDVLDHFGTLVHSFSSAPQTLNPNDTGYFQTNPGMFWATCNDAEQTYQVVFKALSDNIPSVPGSVQPSDTFTIRLTDSVISLVFGDRIDNLIGTNETYGFDGAAFGILLDLKTDERLFKSKAWLSSATVPGGTINAFIYEAPTPFNFLTGFNNMTPIATSSHVVTTADVAANEVTLSFLNPQGYPVFLSAGRYYLVWELYSDNGVAPIFIGNNADFNQGGLSSIMFLTVVGLNPRWYSAFTKSSVFVNPMIQAFLCPSEFESTCMSLHVEDVEPGGVFRVYPNPTDGYLNVHFDTWNAHRFELKLFAADGRAVWQATRTTAAQTTETFDLRGLSPGTYLLRVTTDGGVNQHSYRVIVR